MKRQKILKMGCGGNKSSEENRYVEDSDLKLQACRLTFSHQHFSKLNRKFTNLLENDNSEKPKDRQTAYLGAVVERLIQRLVCSVGHLDPRFSSKFLINLQPLQNFVYEPRKKLRFKYLVRLDLVSTPALYPQVFEPPLQVIEGIDKSIPQGFAKIRVHGEFLEQWAGFISSNGYLRRDKIQEKFLELLAKAAAKPTEPFSPLQVDESKHCGSPGKIVDPITLHHILENSPDKQFFFGPDECNESRFPDPRDFRIAMVEGVPETRLHISFLSPTVQSITSDDVEVSIILGIGVCGWPSETNFPVRLPLDHVDFVLAYQASQLDYYLVPKGPHPSVACDDRSSVWEIRPLATEMFLEHHYSSVSVVSRVFKTLIYLLEIFKARGMKTINKYILKNLLFYELENKKSIQYWKPKEISKRVLSILDHLLGCLRKQMVPSYFFSKKNLLLDDSVLEDDFVSDCDILKLFLKQLHNDGFKVNAEDSDCGLIKDDLENFDIEFQILIEKWGNVVASMLPPMSNRSTRLRIVHNSPTSVSYTNQQIEYVALLVREILKLKNIQKRRGLRNEHVDEPKEEQTSKEDFIFLLQIMFDQAKQELLTSLNDCRRRKLPSRKLLKLDHVLASYDISITMILDDIRRSKEMDFNFPDDASVVLKVMECLYKATDADGKILGTVLRPYLRQIFKGSHENCWFLPEWTKRMDFGEFQAIAAFSNLVISRKINPLDGIINSANKGWSWASNCIRIMREIAEENSTKIVIGEKADISDSGLRLIFAPSPGVSLCFNVSLAKAKNINSTERGEPPKNVKDERVEKNGSDSRYATIKSFQEVLDLALSSNPCEKEHTFLPEVSEMQPIESKKRRHPPHVQLRNNNPFTLAAMELRRQGNHRGLGSIVQALISLQKLNILQEISQYLPESEKIRVLSDIKKLSKEVQRAAVESYRKKKNFSSFKKKDTFIFKRQKKTFLNWPISQKRFSEKYLNSYYEPDCGIYKSVNEFSTPTEDEEFRKRLKSREKQLDEELKKEKRDSLLGTCRELRREIRPTIYGFTDVQTFILAGIATVIPLLIIVATILGIRYLWRKFTARKGEGYEGVLQKEESSEPLGKLQSYSLPQELKTSESQFTVTPGEDATSQLTTPKSNGSVITMTLKNNHLIVETEEASNPTTGIKIESKGTTTKFVTSKAGGFRSENNSEGGTNYNKDQAGQGGSSDKTVSSTDPGILVHCAPDETEDDVDKGSCNTGLSQSDLSVSSTESQNPSYRYGNQVGYESGGYGYPEYSGYSFSERPSQPSELEPKSLKNWSFSVKESIDYDLPGNQPTGPPLKDILMSDIQAREIRVEKNYQEDQKNLASKDPTVIKTEVSCETSSTDKSTEDAREPQTAQLKTDTSQSQNENPSES